MRHMKWLRGLALVLALLLSMAMLAEAAELETSSKADPGIEIEEEELLGAEEDPDGETVDAGQEIAATLDGVELGEVDDELSGLEMPAPTGDAVSDEPVPPADEPDGTVEAPAESEAPGVPEMPVVSDAPIESEAPAAPDVPVEPEGIVSQQAPVVLSDDASEKTEAPQDADAPKVSAEPAAKEDPAEGQDDPTQEDPAEKQEEPAREAPAEEQDDASREKPAPDAPAEGEADPEKEKPAEGQEDAGKEAPAEGTDTDAEEGEAGKEAGESAEEAAEEKALAEANAAKPVFPRALTMGLKEGTRLDASGELDGPIYYVSSKPKVVAVNAFTGQIVAKKKGTARVTAYNAQRQAITCTVKVMKAPKKVQLTRGWLALNPEGSAWLGVKLPKKTASLFRAFASSNPGVATVDSQGIVRAVNPGSAIISVRTFNGKYARCTVVVLNGPAPKALALNRYSTAMGLKEKMQLVPTVDAGAAAAYSWSTSNKRIATVSGSGLVKAKKKGTVRITVTTHNGLRQVCTIRVYKAPKKVTLSASSLRLEAGASARLAARVPSGTGSVLYWASSNVAVASVDGYGLVTARAAGSARIGVRTFNNKIAYCNVTVTAPSAPTPVPETLASETTPVPETAPASSAPTPTPTPSAPTPTPAPTAITLDAMLSNLSRSSAVGTKRDAILNIVELLVKNGFEPAFAAGVAGNIKLEGTYGQFENSNYPSNPTSRPRYFAYLDGGKYYKNGVLETVYVPRDAYGVTEVPEGAAKAYSYGEMNYYKNRYYKKYAWQVNLNELESFVSSLAAEGWTGKFGLGLVQWTGGRTKTLLTYYRKKAGSASTLTQAQVIAAENEMILAELRGGYASVYTRWKNANAGKLTGPDAAASAASIFCLYYEIPANKETAAVARASEARSLYNAMMG